MTTEYSNSNKSSKLVGNVEASAIIAEVDGILDSARAALRKAKQLVTTAGVDTSSWSEYAIASSVGASSTTATAGHSNTDHIISDTGDYKADRIAELRRKYTRRLRKSEPETRGNDRWDKPKVPGERRRRILRDKDCPEAPAEPPPSGYTIFVGQMTTKIRHDRPDEPHDQTRVVQEISIYWRSILTEGERKEYDQFVDQAREEYNQQLREYRATGTYTPSETFEKKPNTNLWVRKQFHDKNALERELETYETYTFPPRPAGYEEEYRKREERSKLRRKLKGKAANHGEREDVSPENVDFATESISNAGSDSGPEEGAIAVEEVADMAPVFLHSNSPPLQTFT